MVSDIRAVALKLLVDRHHAADKDRACNDDFTLHKENSLLNMHDRSINAQLNFLFSWRMRCLTHRGDYCPAEEMEILYLMSTLFGDELCKKQPELAIKFCEAFKELLDDPTVDTKDLITVADQMQNDWVKVFPQKDYST